MALAAPFILLTGSLDEESAVEYMKAGATDYILKDRLARLGPAVRAALDRTRMKQQLDEREEYFRSLIEQAMDIIAVLDAEGALRYASPSVFPLLGYAPEDLVGLSIFALVHPDDVDDTLRVFSEGVATGQGGRLLELRLRHKDGTFRHLEAIGRYLLEDPLVQGVVINARDVTERRALDLNELVADMDKMLRRLLGEDIDVLTKLGSALGAVRADAGQLEQVIVNLAVNARDAMPDGGRLTIETRNAELDDSYVREHVPVQPGRYVMLAVSDTGTGMSAETMSHVFEPFFTTKEPGKGTGLGLATVYGIVKQSGGYVWCYSERGEGGGTTFKVYLPRVDAPVDQFPARAVLPRTPGSETILLVEDEAALRALTRRLLEKHGYTVLEAGTADAALALARAHVGPIHLLLADVVLPGASGPTLAGELLSRRADLKVLFMSGYTEDAIVHRGVLARNTAFINKPFSGDNLAAKVREVLDGS